MNQIDLHGQTVHEAWKTFSEHVSDCYFNDIKATTVITGHGQIGEELIAWVHANKHCQHASKGRNTGAYTVAIKKNKKHKPTVKANTTVDLSQLIKKWNNH